MQQSGRNVTAELVAGARAAGATDREIHDTVLIAAFFCMCNRYVDGLATWAPQDADTYRQRSASVAQDGYVRSMQTYVKTSHTKTAGQAFAQRGYVRN